MRTGLIKPNIAAHVFLPKGIISSGCCGQRCTFRTWACYLVTFLLFVVYCCKQFSFVFRFVSLVIEDWRKVSQDDLGPRPLACRLYFMKILKSNLKFWWNFNGIWARPWLDLSSRNHFSATYCMLKSGHGLHFSISDSDCFKNTNNNFEAWMAWILQIFFTT